MPSLKTAERMVGDAFPAIYAQDGCAAETQRLQSLRWDVKEEAATARERDLHSTLEQDCTAESAETETPQEVRERKHGLLFGWFCFSMLPLAVWLLCGGPK